MSGIVGKNAGRASGIIGAGDIADESIDSDHYVDASIDNAHLADDAVNSDELAAGAVDLAHMSAESVDSDQYVDGSIDEAHIADNAVTLAKMAGGTDGNIISFDASGDPVAIATGNDGQVLTSTGAGSPPAFEAAAGGGDTRNFIIDGDFTQFPEGNITAVANSAYGAALWENFDVGGELVHDIDQLADAPTVGESSHSSTYSMSIDITTAESAVAAGDFQVIEYKVTGSDFAHLNQQQVTLSFWHKHTKTGTFCGYFMNSAEDRSYVYEYTQSSTNTWEKHTETVTLDTSGTWLLTDADIGLRVGFCMYGGSTFQGTADSWEGAKDYCTSNQVAGADDAANFCKFSQVGLYLGSSAPSAFLGEPVSTVKDQVNYYVEKIGGIRNSEHLCMTYLASTTTTLGTIIFATQKRAIPTMSFAGTNSNFQVINAGVATAANADPTFTPSGLNNVRINLTTGGSWVQGQAGIIRVVSTSEYILASARH